MKFQTIEAVEEPSPTAPPWIKPFGLVAADIAASAVAFGASFLVVGLVRGTLDLPSITFASTAGQIHLALVASLSIAVFLWFRSEGHYSRCQALANQIGPVVAASLIAMVGAAAIQFATIEVGSRLLTGLYWALFAPLILVSRLVTRTLIKRAGIWAKPAVMFTSRTRVHELSSFMKTRGEIGVTINQAVSVDDLSVEAITDAMSKAREKGLAILYAPAPGDERQKQVIDRLVVRGVPFILSPDLGPVPHRSCVMEFPPDDIALMQIENPLDRPLGMGAKRVMDICGALIGLLLLSPVLLPVAIAIKADGGPALFRQKRVGKGGMVFECLKFRSMTVNAEEKLQQMVETDPAIAAEWKAYQKLQNDPRITAVGRFVRKTNLDEIPQLINVLKGQMSLVGPRPMTEPQIADYESYFDAYVRMYPGLTGLWQTNGRNATTFVERARLDAWYVRNWSLWRDVVIIARTVREVLFAKGV